MDSPSDATRRRGAQSLFDAWPALWSSVYAYGPVNAPILFFSATIAISLLAIGVAYPLLVRE